MKSVLIFPLRLFAFWLLYFALFRLWFVLWFRQEWSPESPMSTWASFWHALPLDLSMAGYLVAVPMLLWFAGFGIGIRSYGIIEKTILYFNVLIGSGLVFLFGANVFIYEEWHTLLNNRALEYFKTPAALLDSMSLPFKIACVFLYFGGVWIVFQAYKLIVGKKVFSGNTSRRGLLALPVWLALLVLAIRGGLGVMPINESAVYYSAHIFNNHAATNSAWHLVHSKMESRSTENHYRFMSDEAAKAPVDRLLGRTVVDGGGAYAFFETKDSTPLNLVFLIMESHTAQVVEALGGEKGVCPTLERLIGQGILFSNCYGSGYRTDQGIVSVLAGYPAQPDQSIVLLEDKAIKLNSVSKTLKAKGYSAAFLYGGELTFANLGTWLANQRFDKIFSEKDFSSAEKTQRWGVDDKILLQRAVAEINQLPQPFFTTAMTLSLHPPYDVPYQSQWQSNSDREKFLNSAAFADHAIGAFFKSAEQQPWYNNTLFVLVADHGSSLPSGAGLDNPVSRRTPLIIFGHPLAEKWKGKKIEQFCNHHDIPATVLAMMGIENLNKDFPWSRNQWQWYGSFQADTSGVKNPCHNGFAYFTNENGIGWVNDQGKGFYYFGEKRWKFWEGELDAVSQEDAKAYLQSVYEDFLAK